MEQSQLLQFVPFSSCINHSFWNKYTEIKLDVDKLEEKGRSIWGYYSYIESQLSPFIEVDSTSFNIKGADLKGQLAVAGKLFNKNTIENFKDCDKMGLIKASGDEIWENIINGKCLKSPGLLNSFVVLSFADLKKYNYYYWFGFPAPSNVNLKLNVIEDISGKFNNDQMDQLYVNYSNLCEDQKHFFLVHKEHFEMKHLEAVVDLKDTLDQYYMAFSDACFDPKYSGWVLKNFMLFLMYYCDKLRGKQVDFLSFRVSRENGKISLLKSLLIRASLPEEFGKPEAWIGWERNERGKMGPRMVNLKSSIDPQCLAETAVDLNLKLMKWRLLPDIDLEKIKNAKCLLLGSGTLGCSVARVLLGWGVRQIKFVDNSTVSYSNPVRQSLFTYEDCVAGKPKAQAAADNLKKIFPGVESEGYNLTIPMPGHPVGESTLEHTKETVDKLRDLIVESDVVFLLMDSRESRWLPTLLGLVYGKLVLNAALGFDTYLVMRHGVRGETQNCSNNVKGFKMIKGNNLGCYFCNDITAPGNSLKDRSLDQQCTVTRPGISQIAGALVVELAISILQHKLGGFAPAYYKMQKSAEICEDSAVEDCILGVLPHSLRGFLSTFTQVLPATEKYNQCIACSDSIVEAYRTKGFEFLLNVFNSSQVLEDMTGLTEMYTLKDNTIMDMSDSE
ncbi:PREDICTED: ubiquitin-like modifier-activating enzyme ATG7 [Nicrophorus vespilloides]|uniref:Ubiquitin-like modifier-activating enzyme ATG7 n=1 Tax=Nicrophorus vespilloides TaxID=110193 RepID=A0ABM1M646_NICVS|nr:PREDICTED: ubiquitin-like modifier-activating enzyme ATG7 [Nicrophorus vespilloides]